MLYKNIFLILILLFITGCGSDNSKTKQLNLRNTNSIIYENGLHISEILASNAKTNYDPDFKEFSDWIEIYNDSNQTIDLSGYHLSDSKKNIQKWSFPNNITIKPYKYILIWADGRDVAKQALHTNFKLSQDGERVILSDRDGKIVDFIEYGYQEGDISTGIYDGNILYMKPTPNTKNSRGYDILDRSTKPKFSLKSGFYDGAIEVELRSDSDAKIYYTLDGSAPTTNSTLYQAPIDINKTTIIRAISLEEDKFVSRPIQQTYLIDEKITLPIISLAIDDNYLYSNDIGIYKNYKQDWMRAASIEFIKDGESKFSENVGVKIHGGFSRTFPLKSLSIYAKKVYGAERISYPLFKQKPEIKSVKSFILRNAGNDFWSSYIRDGVVHTLAKEIGDIDYLSYEPAVLFVNGVYHGIINIRENPNKNYLESNRNIDKESLNLIKFEYGKPMVKSGNDREFKKLLDFIKNHSLENDRSYKYVEKMIDINSFINYMALEMYIGDGDWLDNNIKVYCDNEKNKKLRWILYDADHSFGLDNDYALKNRYIKANSVEFNSFEYTYDSNSQTATIYKSLMQNKVFKKNFITKFNALLDSTLSKQNIYKIIKTLSNKVEPELTINIKRWREFNFNSIDKWRNEIQKLYDYIDARGEIVKKQLDSIDIL